MESILSSRMKKGISKISSIVLTLTTTIWLSGLAALMPVAVVHAVHTPATESFTFKKTLKFGSRGTDVTELQQILIDEGFLDIDEPTGYYGSLTRTAVMDLQEENDLPRVGVVGPLTRAILNDVLEGGTATPAPAPTPTPTPTATVLGVKVASDTPAAGPVAKNSQDVSMTKLDFTAGDSDVTISSLKVTRSGLSADSDVSNVKLWWKGVQIGSTQALSTTTHTATFTGLNVVVAKNTTESILISATIAASPTVGDTIVLGIAAQGDITSTVAFSGTYPLNGNAKTTAGISVGQLDVDKQTTPAAATILSGATDQSIAAWKFAANATEGFKVQKVKITNTGSAVPADVSNLKLKIGADVVSPTVTALGADQTVTFDLSASPIAITAGTNKIITAYADVAAGINSARTIIFEITNVQDVMATGDNSGGGVTITQSSGTAYVKQTGATMTIGQGTLTVALDTAVNPSNKTYVKGTPGRLFSAFKFSAGSTEGARITEITLTRVGSGTATDLSNITLVNNATNAVIATGGSITGSTVKFGLNTIGYDATGLFDVPVSGNVTVLVKADIASGATATAVDSLEIAANTDIKADGLTSKYDIASGSITDSTGSGSEADHTIGAKGDLTATLSANAPAAANIVKGATGLKYATFTLTAGDGEDVVVSGLTLTLQKSTGTAAGSGDFTNVKVVRSDNNVQYGSTVASPTSSASFSGNLVIPAGTAIDLQVYSDVPTGSASTTSRVTINAAGDLTLTGSSSSASITAGGTYAINANTMTVASGTIVHAMLATPPASSYVINAAGVTLAKLSLTAGTAEDVKVTTIKLTAATSGDTGFVGASTAQTDFADLKLVDDSAGTNISISPSVFTDGTPDTITYTGLEYTVPKGIQKIIRVVGTVKASTGVYIIGVKANGDVVGSGLTSGASISSTDGTVASKNITMTTAGSLAVADGGSPVKTIVAVGTSGKTGVDFARVKLTATNEDIKISKIVITRSGGANGDFSAVKLYDTTTSSTGTQIGSTINFVGTATTVDFNFNPGSEFVVTKDTDKYITVRADLNGTSTGAASNDQPILSLAATTDITATGVASGSSSITITGTVTGNAQALVKAKPIIEKVALSTLDITPGVMTVFKLKITADGGDVKFLSSTASNNMKFTIAQAGGTTTTRNIKIVLSTAPGTVYDQNANSATTGAGNIDFTTAGTANFGFEENELTVFSGTPVTLDVQADLTDYATAGESFRLDINNANTDLSYNDGSATTSDINLTSFLGYGLPITGDTVTKK